MEWQETKAVYDPTHNDIDHRFTSSKIFPNHDSILQIFSKQLLRQVKKQQNNTNGEHSSKGWHAKYLLILIRLEFFFSDAEDDIECTFSAGRYLLGDHIDSHDDRAYKEIDGVMYSRDIACIYYLTDNWTEDDGGTIFNPNMCILSLSLSLSELANENA